MAGFNKFKLLEDIREKEKRMDEHGKLTHHTLDITIVYVSNFFLINKIINLLRSFDIIMHMS